MARKIIPIGKASIGIKCGDCIHFSRISKFEKTCTNLGKKHFADAPDCFSPDVYLLAAHTPEILYHIALLYKDFSSRETRVLLSLLQRTKTLEKVKLHFGMPVYFCLSGDYLNNFYRGYVLDVNTHGGSQRVYVTSDLGKTQRKEPMIGSFLRDSIYSVTEFKKHKASLQRSDKLVDPNPKFSCGEDRSALANSHYSPPSMENAPREWFDKTKKPSVRSAKDRRKKVDRRLDGTLEFKV